MTERIFYLRQTPQTPRLVAQVENSYPCFVYGESFSSIKMVRISCRIEDLGSIIRTLKEITEIFE